jgi:hypothetical protein
VLSSPFREVSPSRSSTQSMDDRRRLVFALFDLLGMQFAPHIRDPATSGPIGSTPGPPTITAQGQADCSARTPEISGDLVTSRCLDPSAGRRDQRLIGAE